MYLKYLKFEAEDIAQCAKNDDNWTKWLPPLLFLLFFCATLS